jgi:threonine synthase
VKYVSTRGQAPELDFEDALLTGLARDGGLYVPSEWPRFSEEEIAGFAGKSYVDVALAVMTPFVGKSISATDLRAMLTEAYATFDHEAVAPLRQTGDNDWVLELFHGPTLAFKDVAMQILARLFDHALKGKGRRLTIVGATSGDTGSAAIEAFRGRDAIDIFIMHPKGRVSEVQRRQMTTVLDANVHNIAIDGSFDDCQALVKSMFNDLSFRDALGLAGVNSINWGRVMAQIVYYFTAAVALGAPARKVSFSVPTGNFGDIFAGYVAREMGLPIEKLLVATNVNDILARALNTGRYDTGTVTPTISPSMDIQVSSNFERLLFDLYDRNGDDVTRLMQQLHQSGGFGIDAEPLEQARKCFIADKADEAATKMVMQTSFAGTGTLVDPHTAVGLSVAQKHRGENAIPMVTLSTAHPAKFPAAVEEACNKTPEFPQRMADLFARKERVDELPNDLNAVEDFIRERSRAAVA